MPFANGRFTRLYSYVTDASQGIEPSSERFDAEFNDFATGLSTAVLHDGTSTITADIPFNGRRVTGLGDATAATDAISWQIGDARYLRQDAGTTDVASAATTDIGAAATPLVRITGTTTITSFGTSANSFRLVTFAGALKLTHNGTSLLLPGAVDHYTVAGDMLLLASDGSGNWTCLEYVRRFAHAVEPDVVIEDQKAAGTTGGASTGTASGGGRETRTLNTLARNANTIASLASNDFTLPAGTYYLAWSAPLIGSLGKTYLRNVTDGADAGVGTNGGEGTSMGSAVVSIAASKAFRVQQKCVTSNANGFGRAAAFANGIEIYARVEIWKAA